MTFEEWKQDYMEMTLAIYGPWGIPLNKMREMDEFNLRRLYKEACEEEAVINLPKPGDEPIKLTKEPFLI